LAIVKHIVERHRGKLDIASTLGQGSTVTVHLPLVEPETTKQD
jgi:two-component system phosphate regulon sensor histidine kinase PhoR